jgi:hypothetical protein
MKLTTIPTRILYTCLCICLASLLFTSCKKLAGLDLQQDADHEITILDPHINKTAWQFLKDRATGPVGTQDTIFRRMYEGIIYAGIDSNEYKKPGRTYIFLHNDAIWRTGNPTPVDSYFGRYKVNNVAATKWQDYTPQQVKNWLLYLIMEGEYSFDNVTPDNVEVKTLMPEGADAANPKSVMTFKVLNDRDSKWRINDFFNTVRATQARTAGIQSDNGPVHVVDRLVEYGVK